MLREGGALMARSSASGERDRAAAGALCVSRRGFLASAVAGACALGSLRLTGCAQPGASGGSAAGGAGSEPVLYDAPARRSCTLMMVGDVLVHQGVWESGQRPDGTRNYDHLFQNVAADAQAADLALLNQETVLGGAGLGLSGYPLFNSPQEMGDAEAAAGFNLVLGATNHALDKGFEGIRSELSFWRGAHPDVTCAGLADSWEAYDALPVIDCGGVRVAVLNYTFSTNGIPLPAEAPFAVRMLDEGAVRSDVAAVRAAGADIVVACPHWGTEYRLDPDDSQRSWAGLFCEVGVDAIIGTHPHVIEPVEVLPGAEGRAVPVFWSLGNFVSTQAAKERMVGGMAQLSFEKGADGCRCSACRMVPVVTHRAQGTAFSVYPLAAYTEDLAAQNGIRAIGGCADFSAAWCRQFCAQVLGAGFDQDACALDIAV